MLLLLWLHRSAPLAAFLAAAFAAAALSLLAFLLVEPLFFVALFGPWWCEIVPVLLVLLAWGAISRRARRGKPR